MKIKFLFIIFYIQELIIKINFFGNFVISFIKYVFKRTNKKLIVCNNYFLKY